MFFTASFCDLPRLQAAVLQFCRLQCRCLYYLRKKSFASPRISGNANKQAESQLSCDLLAQPEDVPGRVRRNTKPPEYLGIEKDRGDCAALSVPQLLASPPTQTERMFSPDEPTPASSCSPTPLSTPQLTPIVTPETSPDTSTVAPPGRLHSPSWLSNHAILPRADPGDILEVNRHWSFGGGETEQWRPYPMLDWTPLARRPPPSF